MSSHHYQAKDVQEAHDRVFKPGRTPPKQQLPPGKTAEQLQEILQALAAIVGHDNVGSGEALLHFSDPFTVEESSFPSAAVCPATVQEIKAILEYANRADFPLWTTSRGKNLGYGGPSPRVKGSVVLSLHRMNGIIEVNEKAAYAVVEPGVTFFDLYNYCREHKLSLWPSVPAIAWGSVIGNTLDRGFGYTALGDHQNNICGLEALLPDGTLVRTGQWAVDKSPSRFACKAGFGPQLDGLFLQSNMGVVTKMGLWIQPQPETTMTLCLELPRVEDLEHLVDIVAELRRDDILQNDPSLFDVFRAISRLGPRHQVYSGSGAIPDETVKRLMREQGLAWWKTWFSLYGKRDMVLSRLASIQQAVKDKCPTARLGHKLFEAGHQRVDATSVEPEWQPMNAGVPSLSYAATIDYNTRPGGYGGHMDFSPILPLDGALALEWYNEARLISRRHGFDSFLGGHAFSKHLVLVHMIMFDRLDAEQVARAKELWLALATRAREFGFASYRTHLDWMDYVQDCYSFNDNAQRRFLEHLKDSTDPNGILSPGKSGIWPNRYRHLRADGSRQTGADGSRQEQTRLDKSKDSR
ncbi:hypothetical protein CDD82_1885 [Ophiocordyceps australis]|uniref:FAD-binding PCMH-type domain-containing protein n=1 Tax=Ophiocordyceps australis TaxID=1399860 RepID=A0A2C5Y243_9HYPO|nr:hypothetical protein CDD82_1885 [Ophiocordyceps australis]